MSTVYHNQPFSSTNVDQEEVKKFDAIAQYWWDLRGPCQTLHEINPLRLTFIQNACGLAGKHIIDVGCGGGILTEALSQSGKVVVGIDQAQEALAVAKNHAHALKNPPHYYQSTVEDYALAHPEAFEVLTCLELLEHVPNPAAVLTACAQLVKPEGDLFFSTLNRTLKGFLLAIVGAEYILKMIPRGTHRYDRFIRPSELAHWGTNAGLQLKHIKGFTYHPFEKTFRLSNDVSINYILHFKKR